MNKSLRFTLFIALVLANGSLFSQFLHHDWTQSYSTHETAQVLDKEEFAFCFGVNNYFLAWSKDSTSYDLLRFDILIRYGLLKKLEFALKYSYPAAALVRFKYELMKHPLDIAVEFGIGHYKVTNQDYKTDYVFDFYPGIIFGKKIYKQFSFYIAPKFIYSFYITDQFAKPPRIPLQTERCYQYGYSWGFAIGDKTMFNLENNWYWSRYEKVKFKVHQIGFAITRFLD